VRLSPTTSGKVRGFTLIELMVVVVIIAVLAVIAVPLFSARMQSRHLLQVAGHLADLYRGSRTRALARGAAVVVTVNLTDQSFQVLEGVEGTAVATASGATRATCGNLPTRGCLTNDWGNVGGGSVIGTARPIEGISNQGITTAVAVGGVAQSSQVVAVCFSPSGRTFVNAADAWTPASWSTLGSVMTIDVGSPSTTSRSYRIMIMPNGTARFAQ